MRRLAYVIFSLAILSTAEAAHLDLAWDPNQEPDLAGYKVYYGTSPEEYINCLDVGKTETYRLRSLLEDVIFHIAVTAYDVAGNESEFSEEVSGLGVPDDWCTVISPNGGEIIPSGSTCTIAWSASAEAETFKLEYSLNNGKKWKLIDTGITGTRYDWQVPIPKGNRKKCLIKVTGYDALQKVVGEDSSDGTFAIEVLKVTSPVGGETLMSGDIYAITWITHETKEPVERVELLCIESGQKTWQLVDTLTGNPGSYDWTVPEVERTKRCRLKIVLRDAEVNLLGVDRSDGKFTIDPF